MVFRVRRRTETHRFQVVDLLHAEWPSLRPLPQSAENALKTLSVSPLFRSLKFYITWHEPLAAGATENESMKWWQTADHPVKSRVY